MIVLNDNVTNSAMPMIPVARPSLGPRELEAVSRVFDSRWLGLGAVTAEFEDRLSHILGGRLVVATNTGTSAIEVALRVIGVGPGDDVITPAMTFVATAQAIAATGARPVLCDIDPRTLNVSVATIEAARTQNTKAVVPVDYRGLPVDIESIVSWAERHGIRVVQDAAHSFGSRYENGSLVGSVGDITCFSFDPIKNITCGEGGAIILSERSEYARANRLRVLGIDSTTWSRLEARRPWEYDVSEVGYRYHMPNFAAAIGIVQLERLSTFVSTKQNVLKRYLEATENIKHLEMPTFPTDLCVPFLAVVLTDERDRLMNYLRDAGIGSGVQYQALSSFTLFSSSDGPDLPTTLSVEKRLLTLPLLNDQTTDEQDRVVAALMSFPAS